MADELDYLELPPGVIAAIRKDGRFFTLQALHAATAANLAQIPRMGPHRCAQIRAAVSQAISFGLPPAPVPGRPRLVATLPEGASVIALTIWRDYVVLATTTGVYIMARADDGFVPLKFQETDDGR